MTTMKEKLFQELEKLQKGEIQQVEIIPQGYSIDYLRNLVSKSEMGPFTTKYLKGSGSVVIKKRIEKTASIISSDKLPPEDDLPPFFEEDFKGI